MLDPRGRLLRAAVEFAQCSMLSYDNANPAHPISKLAFRNR